MLAHRITLRTKLPHCKETQDTEILFYSPTQGSPKHPESSIRHECKKANFWRIVTLANKLSINPNLSAGIRKISEKIMKVNVILVSEFLLLRLS